MVMLRGLITETAFLSDFRRIGPDVPWIRLTPLWAESSHGDPNTNSFFYQPLS